MRIQGKLRVPGDKSISHRAVMFGSLAHGKTYIDGFLAGADCLSTIACFREMGIEIERDDTHVTVIGKGLRGLKAPSRVLDCGNSGTTTRLISGILSAQNFSSELTGDASIRKRPMKRVMIPLKQMGADIIAKYDNDCAPLLIHGKELVGINYLSPVASAQVKSAILLAGLYVNGKTSVTEPTLSRNHTEIMLKSFGANIKTHGTCASIYPVDELYATKIHVPADISSAAFFIVATLLVPNSELLLTHVGINPTRDGILHVLRDMGADIEIMKENLIGEPYADILIRSSSLHGCEIGGAIIPTLIDEIPMLAALATVAEGKTIIKDAAELKVKESNRIRVMCEELTKLGAIVTETKDGMIIEGSTKLHGDVTIETHDDHRIAMAFAILNLINDGEIKLDNPRCVEISYPGFFEDLMRIVI